MSCVEHIIENAITAIKNNETYEEWLEREKNLNLYEVASPPEEIWEMANYVFYYVM